MARAQLTGATSGTIVLQYRRPRLSWIGTIYFLELEILIQLLSLNLSTCFWLVSLKRQMDEGSRAGASPQKVSDFLDNNKALLICAFSTQCIQNTNHGQWVRHAFLRWFGGESWIKYQHFFTV